MEVRKEHLKEELETLLRTAQEGIYLAAERWPGVESALALYGQLGAACLKAYDCTDNTFRLIGCTSTSPVHRKPYTIPPHSQPPNLSVTTTYASSNYDDRHGDQSLTTRYVIQPDHLPIQHAYSPPALSDNDFFDSGRTDTSRSDTIRQPTFAAPSDQAETYNEFHSNLPDLKPWTPPAQPVPEQYLGSIGDQYLQYFHAPYVPHQPIRRLSQEEQTELMNDLEINGIYGRTQEKPDEAPNYFPDLCYGS